jgi:hypothetical protein
MASMALANGLSATAVHVEGPLTGAVVGAGVEVGAVVAGAGVDVGAVVAGVAACVGVVVAPPRLQATKAKESVRAKRNKLFFIIL